MGYKGEKVGAYTLIRKTGPCPEGEDWKAQAADGSAVGVRLFYEPFWINAFQDAGIPEAVPVHPNLDRLLEIAHDNRPWIAWSYAEGRSLREILQRRPYVPLRYALPLMLQVVRGLAALHAGGLAHHDLRPENVIVDDQGGTVLVRMQTPAYRVLALQKLRDKRNPMKAPLAEAIRAYLPPEQSRAKVENGTAGDMYSLGRLMFETLCGELPHPLEMRHPSQRDPRIPKIFDKLVIDLLERRVRARIPDATTVEASLLEGCRRARFAFDFERAPLSWVSQTPWQQSLPAAADLQQALAEGER